MNILIRKIKQNMTCIFLSAFTGAVLATGIVVLTSSQKVAGVMLARWQIAAIYVAAITACVLLGLKNNAGNEAENIPVADKDSISNPSL